MMDAKEIIRALLAMEITAEQAATAINSLVEREVREALFHERAERSDR